MGKISIYTVDDKPIGTGGMGTVYRGWDDMGHQVAIKEMRAELIHDENLRQRFIQEVTILSNMDNPHIVGMLGSFNYNNNLYLVMDFVEGVTIEKYVSEHGPMPEELAVRLMEQILGVLQYVHEQGIVHRDIKPSNIMLKGDQAILLDFGIAKDMNGKGLTIGQFVLGTDGYMSPEQAEGLSIDHRSDIYALGCVFYYMLTGRHAIQTRNNDHETRMAVINSVFPRAKDFRPDLSDFIQSVLDKATDKNMTRRFQSCNEFKMTLEHQGGTFVDTSDTPYITVGRENCDITIYDPQHKVSRHHANIEKGVASESDYYKFTDCSSNGSIVDGKLVKNDSVYIYYNFQGKNNPLPDVFLANREHPLNWSEVEAAFHKKGLSSHGGGTVGGTLNGGQSGGNSGGKEIHPDNSGSNTGSSIGSNANPLDTLNFGWIILAFLVPIVGWVMYYQWKDYLPNKAKSICITAWVGFVFNLIMYFVL